MLCWRRNSRFRLKTRFLASIFFIFSLSHRRPMTLCYARSSAFAVSCAHCRFPQALPLFKCMYIVHSSEKQTLAHLCVLSKCIRMQVTTRECEPTSLNCASETISNSMKLHIFWFRGTFHSYTMCVLHWFSFSMWGCPLRQRLDELFTLCLTNRAHKSCSIHQIETIH